MDDFVCEKLIEWGLRYWIGRFKDEGIDKKSFYHLDNDDIKDLIPEVRSRKRFKEQLKLLKVLAKSDNEKDILSKVKNIIARVHRKLLDGDKTMLNAFLKEKICDLETEKKELVGVFGRTGAGKSSLINAVVGEKDLLPSGSVSACTTVIIKVEANSQNQNYEAEIEFIPKEEWELKQLLLYLSAFIENAADQEEEDADEYNDAVEILSALYGEEWRNDYSEENLISQKYFREIPEFFNSQTKTLTAESAKELSAKLVKYTRSSSEDGDDEVNRWFWPLVKCVTIRVPNNDLLKNVTLVDLPGNGDRNKGRDKMWKGVVEKCSTVWIVADINRAVSEKEPWEILQSASSIMGNGGQCQHIHFICTKSDVIEDSDDLSVAAVHNAIIDRNTLAKEEVWREFRKLKEVKKHFSDDCFKVFTLSSKEFWKNKWLNPNETEVPKLQEFLQRLNDSHSKTLNYVAGAYGILSLIPGASCREMAGTRARVCADLEENMSSGLKKVSESMLKALDPLKNCLTKAVEESKSSCESALQSFLKPKGVPGRASRLKCVVANNGIYKSKKKGKRKKQSLNKKLASCLRKSIHDEFMKNFPNESKREPLNGAISSFSLDTGMLVENNKDLQLQLDFLRTEEEKVRKRIHNIIRDRKEEISSCLTIKIVETMQKCYDDAKGAGSLKVMRTIIKRHVRNKKDVMFEEAKDAMLSKLQNLLEDILKTLKETIEVSIELSLKTDYTSLPDVKEELETVTKYYNILKENRDEEMEISN